MRFSQTLIIIATSTGLGFAAPLQMRDSGNFEVTDFSWDCGMAGCLWAFNVSTSNSTSITALPKTSCTGVDRAGSNVDSTCDNSLHPSLQITQFLNYSTESLSIIYSVAPDGLSQDGFFFPTQFFTGSADVSQYLPGYGQTIPPTSFEVPISDTC